MTMRIVAAGYATLHDVREKWSCIDVLDALDFMDAEQLAQRFQHENAKEEAEIKRRNKPKKVKRRM